MDDYFRFSKKMGFWVFLVHPTVVLVLLSASVERCFVSRMRVFSSSLPTSLLYIVGELAEGESMALAVVASDRQQVTCEC